MRLIRKYHIDRVIVVAAILFIFNSIIPRQSISAFNSVKLPNPDSVAVETPYISEIEPVISSYDSSLTYELKKSANIGAAAAIIRNNRIVYLKCFGVKKIGTKDSIDPHTIFRLASVSKTISGILAGKLAADDSISLDDKVSEYFPDFKLRNEIQARELTIRHLLSHSTGMPAHTYDDLVEQKVPFRQIMEKLPQANAAGLPGSTYTYQNVMFSLFDSIVSLKTGKDYESVLDEEIFSPFSMNDATTGFESFAGNSNKALPHSWTKRGYRLQPLNDRYYNTLAAAGINASISDMANFVLTLLNSNDEEICKATEIAFTPQIDTRLSAGYFSNWDKVDSKAYGIGWRIVNYKGRKISYHGGFVRGYRAEIAVCPEENTGIVFLSNSPNSAAGKSVPLFLNRLFEWEDGQKIGTNSDSGSNSNKL